MPHSLVFHSQKSVPTTKLPQTLTQCMTDQSTPWAAVMERTQKLWHLHTRHLCTVTVTPSLALTMFRAVIGFSQDHRNTTSVRPEKHWHEHARDICGLWANTSVTLSVLTFTQAAAWTEGKDHLDTSQAQWMRYTLHHYQEIKKKKKRYEEWPQLGFVYSSNNFSAGRCPASAPQGKETFFSPSPWLLLSRSPLSSSPPRVLLTKPSRAETKGPNPQSSGNDFPKMDTD